MHSNLQEMRDNRRDSNAIDIFHRFPDQVKPYLLKGLSYIQINDGCLGRCPWCALEVKRDLTEAITLDDWLDFASKFVIQMPKEFSLYWASDPGDVAGFRKNGEHYDYADLLRETIPFLRRDQSIYTSTVIPEGTEEVIERTALVICEAWFKDLRNCITTRDHKSIGNRINHIRFSRTEKNAKYISELKARLAEYANKFLPKGFMVEDESRSPERIQHQGNYFKHPGRDNFSTDMIPVACYDGTLLTTEGVFAINFDLATKLNPFGYTKIRLDPYSDTLSIPRLVRAREYSVDHELEFMIDRTCPPMLPPTIVDIIDNKTGNIVGTQNLDSTRRLGNAIFLIYMFLIEKQSEIIAAPAARPMLLELQDSMEQRKSTPNLLFENDVEAVNFTNHYHLKAEREIKYILNQLG